MKSLSDPASYQERVRRYALDKYLFYIPHGICYLYLIAFTKSVDFDTGFALEKFCYFYLFPFLVDDVKVSKGIFKCTSIFMASGKNLLV
jgi:hypothetical protein